MSILKSLKTYKAHIMVVAIAAVCLYLYTNLSDAQEAVNATSIYTVETVARGDVSSGIETTGEIVAAQKLDLDVYKQTEQIDSVNVVNGQHVEAGDVLISFDKSDAYVDAQSAQVAVVGAELTLEEKELNAVEPSTAIRSKENQITSYEKIITDATQDIADAYRDFLNEDLEVSAHEDEADSLNDRAEPALSGRYVSDVEGEYVIEVYASRAESGYSFRLSGLETMTEPVIFGKAINLGTRGLKITFPNDTKSNDKWIVRIPNNEIATFQEAESDYEKTVSNLEKTIEDAQVDLLNATQELADLQLADGVSYRNLSVEEAESSLAEAQQRLYQYYDVVQDRDIVAPFSGTVEGMENVVTGATPVGGTSDSISLGTLISDDFLATFSLGAVDVAKVEVGQKVLVTITSFANSEPLEAYISEISSLPDAAGVAQYGVQALIEIPEGFETELREGLLADIEVVQEEVTDVVRIPSAAVTYERGVATVEVVDEVTDEQAQMIQRLGILRSDSGDVQTYPLEVTIGLTGAFYAEVTNGLEEGVMIITSANSAATETATPSIVGQDRVPGGGGVGAGGGQRQQ
jgi:multidrug efflux pump subunit AcrA (membrane-fusion protein)